MAELELLWIHTAHNKNATAPYIILDDMLKLVLNNPWALVEYPLTVLAILIHWGQLFSLYNCYFFITRLLEP